MKKLLSVAVIAAAISFAPAVAIAETPCKAVDSIHSHVTTLERALASKSVGEMKKAVHKVGVHVSGGVEKASKTALVMAIRMELGSLRTLLTLSEAACHKDRTVETAKATLKKAKSVANKASKTLQEHICYKKSWPGIKIPYPC